MAEQCIDAENVYDFSEWLSWKHCMKSTTHIRSNHFNATCAHINFRQSVKLDDTWKIRTPVRALITAQNTWIDVFFVVFYAGIHKFLCSVCGQRYATRASFRYHSLLHSEPTIQCPACPAKFYRQKCFNEHYEWHQNLTFTCNECNRTCPTRRSLQAHTSELIIWNLVSYQYLWFFFLLLLVILGTVHRKSSKRKSECPHCGLKCKSLKTHLRTHTGEKRK